MNCPGPRHDLFRAQYLARGDWIAGRVPDPLARFARETPGKAAVIDRDGALDYATLDDLVHRFAAALIERGIGPGDRVAIQLPNVRAFVIAQQAALRLGCAYVPLLPQLGEADVGYALEASGARAMVMAGDFRGQDQRELAGRLPVEHVFVTGDGFDAALDTPCEDRHRRALDAIAVSPDALRVVLFTSGTEARPKGVLHSYNTQYVGLKRHQAAFELSADDVVMCVSPVGHGTGAVNGVEFALHLGGTVVMLEAWEPRAGLAAMAEHGATMMWGATTFYSDLVGAAMEAGGARPDAFRYAFTAGAPVPGGLVRAVRERLGARLVTAYGQSEGQNIAITAPDDPEERLTDSDGRVHDSIEWKLVDADRRPLPPGAAGEFAYRGPNLCLGYLDPAHTAAAFDDGGFCYSGDLARVDTDGYLRIVGRAKDIIIRGGENISPAEVEELLFDHPEIARVSVIGYPDERLGERACAVVVPAAGASLSIADLVAHMAAKKVAKFKFPERLLLVDDLATTPSGKVRKDVLRRLLAEGAA